MAVTRMARDLTGAWAVLPRRGQGPRLRWRRTLARSSDRLWAAAFGLAGLAFLGWGALWSGRLAEALVAGAGTGIVLAAGGALVVALATGVAVLQWAAGIRGRPGAAAARPLAAACAAGAVLLGAGPVVLATLAAAGPGLLAATLLVGASAWLGAVWWRRGTTRPGGAAPSAEADGPAFRERVRRRPGRDARRAAGNGPDPRWLACLQLAGIRAATATELHRAGFRTLEDLARAEDAALLAVRGIGPATLRRLRAAVSARLALEQAARPHPSDAA